MTLRFLVPFLVSLAALGGTSTGQQLLAAAAAAPCLAPVRDQGQDADGRAVGSWAAADDFKCGWADGTFTVVPYLGESAPHNLPWRWRTTAVTLGATDLRQGQAWRPQHGDQRFAAVAGLVREHWDLRPDAVEQSFLVYERPAAGELVVRGVVEGALVAAPRPARVAPLVFRDGDGRVELHYGSALAVDADGRQWPVPTSFDGSCVGLHVPAEVVAAARFPLLIDPLLTVWVIASGTVTSGSGLTDSCVADVDASDRMTIVRSEVRWSSVLDSDLLVWKCRDDLAVSQLVHSDLDPNAVAFGGSVAAVGNNQSFVVAWSRGPSASAAGAVWFTLPADSYGPATVHTLTRPGGTIERSVRVAGRRGQVAGSPANALLVRLRETANGTDRTELWGSMLDCATGTAGAAFLIADGGTSATPVDNDEPWVSRDPYGPWGHWLVAYQTYTPTTGLWSVRVRRVAHAGGVSGSFTPTVQGGHHAMQPRVEGSSGRFLIAFATASAGTYPGKLSTYGGSNVYAQRFAWSDPTATIEHAPVNLAASFARDLLLGGIAHDGLTRSHWAVSVGSPQGAPTILQLGYRGRVVRSVQLTGPGSAGTLTFRAVSLAFDRRLERFALHCGIRGVAAGVTSFYSYGGSYEYPALAPATVYGPACSGGLVGYGKFRIGSEFAGLSLYSIGPLQPAVLALSLQPSSLPLASFGLPGGCSLLVDLAAPNWLGALTAVTDENGDARIDLPLPEGLAPLDLCGQWLRLEPSGAVRATQGVFCEVR